ncbi:hypothetical protein FO510_05610 [Bacillus pumilus]|uniref:hypothetical protein n=1 Tax=Bacillus pumilus TaxID=1408 RepID=UPI00017A5EE9|nr:hypothetical protein [Bacillus pumilus]EDW22275.1 hypothetical protein BAT_0113 [Bacillus pumilus ATCC 7061]MCR4352154.1 hypothetical protein [Bacillus pumilus]MCY7503965.1 hypothetical protein [Bacillus pumilus]MDR4269041.1 hypothetical protein [Bacillus pumilus]MDR4269128.1 hypothetical protein [Bacillus pumilus]
MAATVEGANDYINTFLVDTEDWIDADEEKKSRLLNRASSTLTRVFSKYIIPDKAVYEFVNVLAIAYNDTNRLNKHGISSFSITGVGSFNYKDTLRVEDEDLIPKESIVAIEEENDVKFGGKRIRRTVL